MRMASFQSLRHRAFEEIAVLRLAIVDFRFVLDDLTGLGREWVCWVNGVEKHRMVGKSALEPNEKEIGARPYG